MSLLKKLGKKEDLFQYGALASYSHYNEDDFRFLEKSIAVFKAEIDKLNRDKTNEINRMKLNNFFQKKLIPEKEKEIEETFKAKLKEPERNLGKLQSFKKISRIYKMIEN